MSAENTSPNAPENVSKWLNAILPATEISDFQSSLKQHPPRCVRLSPTVPPEHLSFKTSPVRWYKTARVIEDTSVRPSQFAEFASGDYYIQDAGSTLALELLNIQPGQRICDLCAAPGAKSSGILEALDGQGWLLANEVIKSRVDVLEWSLARTFHSNYLIASRDPAQLTKHLRGCFDAILVDAPCSGQAMVANQKRSNNAFDETQIQHSAERQKRILHSAVRLLRPGGRLVYSTCTFNQMENEDQIQWLINSMPNCWQPVDLPHLQPFQSPISEGCYRVWPHRDRCAGAFAAALDLVGELPLEKSDALLSGQLQNSNQSRTDSKYANQRRQSKTKQSKLDFDTAVEPFGQWTGSQPFIAKNAWHAFSEQIDSQYHSAIHEIAALPPRLIEKADHAVPRPAWPLAMLAGQKSQSPFKSHSTVTMRGNAISAYMRGESIVGRFCTNQTAWAIACYNDKPLGWLKQIQNRANNHLPKPAQLNIRISTD